MIGIIEDIGIFFNIAVAVVGAISSYAILRANLLNLEKSFQKHIDESKEHSDDFDETIRKIRNSFITRNEIELYFKAQEIVNSNIKDKISTINDDIKNIKQ